MASRQGLAYLPNHAVCPSYRTLDKSGSLSVHCFSVVLESRYTTSPWPLLSLNCGMHGTGELGSGNRLSTSALQSQCWGPGLYVIVHVVVGQPIHLCNRAKANVGTRFTTACDPIEWGSVFRLGTDENALLQLRIPFPQVPESCRRMRWASPHCLRTCVTGQLLGHTVRGHNLCRGQWFPGCPETPPKSLLTKMGRAPNWNQGDTQHLPIFSATSTWLCNQSSATWSPLAFSQCLQVHHKQRGPRPLAS